MLVQMLQNSLCCVLRIDKAADLNDKLTLYPVRVNGFVGHSSGSSEYISVLLSTPVMCISRLKKNYDNLDFLVCSAVRAGLVGNVRVIKSLRKEMMLYSLMIDYILDELASTMEQEESSILVSDVRMHNNDTVAILDCLRGFQTVSSAFELTVCVLKTHRTTYKRDIEKLYAVF